MEHCGYRFRRDFPFLDVPLPSLCCAQVANSNEIIRSEGHLKRGVYQADPANVHFSDDPNGLAPTESLFDAFALALTHLVPAVSGCTPVNCAAPNAVVLRNVRSYTALSQSCNKACRIVSLIPAKRHPAQAAALDRMQRGLALCGARRMPDVRIDNQAVAILHQRVPQISPAPPARPYSCGTGEHRDRWLICACRCCAVYRESPLRHFGRRRSLCHHGPLAESSCGWPMLQLTCHPR